MAYRRPSRGEGSIGIEELRQKQAALRAEISVIEEIEADVDGPLNKYFMEKIKAAIFELAELIDSFPEKFTDRELLVMCVKKSTLINILAISDDIKKKPILEDKLAKITKQINELSRKPDEG